MVKSLFVIGLTLVAIGILLLLSPPLVGPGHPPNYAEAYSGLPFVIVGFAILVWGLLSRNGNVSSAPAQGDKSV